MGFLRKILRIPGIIMSLVVLIFLLFFYSIIEAFLAFFSKFITIRNSESANWYLTRYIFYYLKKEVGY